MYSSRQFRGILYNNYILSLSVSCCQDDTFCHCCKEMRRSHGGPPSPPPDSQQGAVALGRLGGLKGGKARTAKLTAEQRRELARKAVNARWAMARKKDQQKDLHDKT
jgi:hypothetical protein